MKLKFTGFLLIILQYGSCLDYRNCSGDGDILAAMSTAKFTFKPNPKMKFYLFTRKNFFNEQQIFSGNRTSLINSNFNQRWPVRIIVHGWRDSLMSCLNGYVKDAYLQKGYFNVIVVDWSDWSQNIDYFTVVPYIFKILGPLLAKFIIFLNQNGNIPYNNIYLIGHSLGAHLSGSAGQNIRPNKVNTIFGLDPAGPGFQGNSSNQRLDKSQAKYVEQISTDTAKAGYFGTIGTAAFYPNYSILQPYCILNDLKNLACSHSLSYWYFAESIITQIGFCAESCSFSNIIDFGCSALQCSSKKQILMGGEPSTPKTGTFFVKTNANPDFANCDCYNHNKKKVLS